MNLPVRAIAWVLAAFLVSHHAAARPIGYAHSTTVMADYTDGKMAEAQIFYAPTSFMSLGVGHMDIEGGGAHPEHNVSYFRVNFLAKRWNMEAAQANVFFWGGVDSAHMTQIVSFTELPGDSGHNHGAPAPPRETSYERTIGANGWNAGGQIDFETRRIYSSFKTDSHYSSAFTHRVDMLQFGIAPYVHDTNTLATWFVVCATRYSGNAAGAHGGDQLSFLVRFFKKRTWIEAGATTDGRLQARAMFSL
ncbi:MAG TPA: hypothetical protein VK624_08375 [Steroidobacteraceae bacterium]|nr:hypothetical protein [Steroidobacteraceae bacterium]